MSRKIALFSIIILLICLNIFITSAQENQNLQRFERNRSDYEFNRLSREERLRNHVIAPEEDDESERMSGMRIRDEAEIAQNQTQTAARPDTSASSQSRTGSQLSERELNEKIEQMLDELITQLEVRISNNMRLKLKAELFEYLKKLVQKYRVQPERAEDLTRDRARTSLENIRNGNAQQTTPPAAPETTPPATQQPAPSGNAFEQNPQPRIQTEPATRTQPQTTPGRNRTNARRTPTGQQSADMYVNVDNRTRVRATARRQTRTARQATAASFYIKHFVVGSDKRGMIVKKTNPVRITITVYGNIGYGKNVYAVFMAESLKTRKKYKFHSSKPFLMADARSQYQFFWGGDIQNSRGYVPDGKYKLLSVAVIYDGNGKKIGTTGRYWGGGAVSLNSR